MRKEGREGGHVIQSTFKGDCISSEYNTLKIKYIKHLAECVWTL